LPLPLELSHELTSLTVCIYKQQCRLAVSGLAKVIVVSPAKKITVNGALFPDD
jgi:hypothetical protein